MNWGADWESARSRPKYSAGGPLSGPKKRQQIGLGGQRLELLLGYPTHSLLKLNFMAKDGHKEQDRMVQKSGCVRDINADGSLMTLRHFNFNAP